MKEFELIKKGETATALIEVENGMNLPSETAEISSPFSVDSFEGIEGNFPASSTVYVDENGLIQNSEGAFYTSSQGFGCIGFTDSEGKLTIDPVPHDFVEVLGMDTASGLINVKYHDQNINII